MAFKKLMGVFGVGGPKVDTVLPVPSCHPGGTLDGEVHIIAADYNVDIERVTLSLVTNVENEYGDDETTHGMEFRRYDVSGPFTLPAGANQVIPFQLPVPWETPVTEFYGAPLHGMVMGVRTELAVSGAVDKGDLDLFSVTPLPSQERVLEGFAQAGFTFKSADVEYGQIAGVAQELPFYQEIEFFPPPAYQGRVNEVELTFVTDAAGIDVVLEADKQTGLYSSDDQLFRTRVGHEEALAMNWAAELTHWLDSLAGGHVGHAGFGHHGDHGFHHADHGFHHAEHGHGSHGHGSHGPGWGGVAAGAAAGFVAGMVADEVVEEIFGDDEDEDD